MSETHHLFPGKVFISSALEALEAKHALSGQTARRYLMRAAMAGIIIGLFYVAYFSVLAAFGQVSAGGDTTLRPLGRIVGAFVFGWALVFIYFTRSELLTSNMMIVTVGAYHRRTSWALATRLLGLCYLGNLIGGVIVALLLRFSTITGGGVFEEMLSAVEHKTGYLTAGAAGWGDLFARAILCNLLINISMLLVYNGFVKEDVTKALTMVAAVFLFAFAGLEHSVANTVLFAVVGLQHDLALGPALGNIVLALLGNYVGGGLLVGLYYAYLNDDRHFRHEKVPVAS